MARLIKTSTNHLNQAGGAPLREGAIVLSVIKPLYFDKSIHLHHNVNAFVKHKERKEFYQNKWVQKV